MSDTPDLPLIFPGAGADNYAPRILGCLPPRPDFGGLPRFSLNQVIPRDQWQDVDLSPLGVPVLDQGQHGCHDERTEVLTERGWKSWGDYDRKCRIGTMNPITGFLEFQMPSAFQAYEYDGLMHYSENRSVDFALTPNHRMFLRKWDERARKLSDQYEFRQIDELGWYAGLPHATRGFSGLAVNDLTIDAGPTMVGDDFVALVAIVLSCGWAGGTENTWNRVGFCCFKDEEYPRIAALAARLGFHEQESRRGVWCKSDPALARWFRANAYTTEPYRAENKTVPQIIKCVDSRQVSLFLDYFGDKSEARGARTFWSSSPRLISDLQELLLRVGRRGTMMDRDPRDTQMLDGRRIEAANCKREYSLYERTTERLSLERKKDIAIERYKGNVFCATVPNSTIVTRRNGKVLISGNSCVGHGSTSAYWFAYLIAGGTVPDSGFSPTSLYALINGGRDNGAIVSDAMDALISTGLCLMSEVPESVIYLKQIPRSTDATRKRFRVSDAYHCGNFDEIGSALQLGFPVSFGITLYRSFESGIGSDGIAPPPRGGVIGGHCMCAYGVTKIAGKWYLRVRNSWNTRWGNGGNCYLPEEWFPGTTDAFAIRANISDPLDPNPIPVAN